MTSKARSPIPARSPGPFVKFDKDELRQRLTPIEYRVTQEHDTEKPKPNTNQDLAGQHFMMS